MSTTDRTRPPLIYTSIVRAAPAAVFDAFFRSPEAWLCRSATVDPRVGGEVRFCWPNECFVGRFVQCEAPTLARFSWHMQGDPLPETMVVLHCDPAADGGTELELEHYGFGVGGEWDMLYVGCARAWASYLKNLRAVLELGTDLREADE